jgi:hypothetical protein
MDPDAPKTCPSESRRWLDRFFHWSNFWFHIGLWIWAGSLWLLKWWLPIAFRPVELSGGFLTAMAVLYILHYFVFVTGSPVFRWICIPLVALIDLFALVGIIAALFHLT